MKTYKVIRFYQDDNKPSVVLLTGLTLEQAQHYCRLPETKGKDWFDGYEEEDKT